MPLTFVVLFILILLVLFFIWWILSAIFKPIGKVVEHDVELFKKKWNELDQKDQDHESKIKYQ